MHTFADSTSSHNNLLIWSVVSAVCTQAAENANNSEYNQWFGKCVHSRTMLHPRTQQVISFKSGRF